MVSVAMSKSTILWSEKSLSTFSLGMMFGYASWMTRSRVLDSLCVGLFTLLTRLKLVQDVQEGGWLSIKWFIDGNVEVS